MKNILIILVLLSCGKAKPPVVSDAFDNPALDAKAAIYAKAFERHQESHGFISDNCDSLLFSSLLAATSVPNINIMAARDDSGAWHRQPDKRCYPQDSKSEISRDMLLGVIFWAVHSGQAKVLEEMYQYGKDHQWIMGDGDKTRTVFTADMIETLEESLAYLRGQAIKPQSYYFVALPTAGYASHLQTLHILIVGKIRGKIQANLFQALQANLKRNPGNGLFQYAVAKYSTGLMTNPIATLLDESIFPSDRLPTTKDHCTEYLWQREAGSDWAPCLDREVKEHNGADFLFLYGLLKNG